MRSSSSPRLGLEPAVATRPSGRSVATEWCRRGMVATAAAVKVPVRQSDAWEGNSGDYVAIPPVPSQAQHVAQYRQDGGSRVHQLVHRDQ
jgi:hypothetical protein